MGEAEYHGELGRVPSVVAEPPDGPGIGRQYGLGEKVRSTSTDRLSSPSFQFCNVGVTRQPGSACLSPQFCLPRAIVIPDPRITMYLFPLPASGNTSTGDFDAAFSKLAGTAGSGFVAVVDRRNDCPCRGARSRDGAQVSDPPAGRCSAGASEQALEQQSPVFRRLHLATGSFPTGPGRGKTTRSAPRTPIPTGTGIHQTA